MPHSALPALFHPAHPRPSSAFKDCPRATVATNAGANHPLTFGQESFILAPMRCSRPILFSAVCMLLAVGLSGCFPSGDNSLDESKDPHYQRGMDLINSQELQSRRGRV